MHEEFFKIIGILIVCFFIIYIVVKMFHLQATVLEGLTNGTETSATTPSSGEAGTAASYAAAIKANVVKIQDELLVAKYRKDHLIHLKTQKTHIKNIKEILVNHN